MTGFFSFVSLTTFQTHYFMLQYPCISLGIVVIKNGKEKSECGGEVEGYLNVSKEEAHGHFYIDTPKAREMY